MRPVAPPGEQMVGAEKIEVKRLASRQGAGDKSDVMEKLEIGKR